MGKQGPCYHCGTKNTPLWRNGPPEKPILCNACGSRYRIKGTSENYYPLHRPFSIFDSTNSKTSEKNKSKASKGLHIKVKNDTTMEGEETFTRDSMCSTKFEDDTSNRSSSESAMLCSESCIDLESMNKKEISGSGQPSFWDQQIPSRKRSKIRRSSTSLIEILRRDLIYTLQEKELCYLSESSEDLLIYKREDARFSNEIGLGTVLLNHRPLSFKEEYESRSIVMKNMVSSLNDTNMSLSSSSSSPCLYCT